VGARQAPRPSLSTGFEASTGTSRRTRGQSSREQSRCRHSAATAVAALVTVGTLLVLPPGTAPWRHRATANRPAYDLPHLVLPVEAGLDAEVGAHQGTYSRECLALEVTRSITAKDVLNTLARQFMQRGEPDHIRSDNGPEFIAKALRKRLAASGVKTLYIEPSAPWENAYSQRHS
jgi:transposase InsO family protein